MTQSQNPTSPSWGTNTKLVVALTIVVIIGALLVKFQFIISPLLIALLLAYLFHSSENCASPGMPPSL
jgi:predicted PurR-regulated permease PerM